MGFLLVRLRIRAPHAKYNASFRLERQIVSEVVLEWVWHEQPFVVRILGEHPHLQYHLSSIGDNSKSSHIPTSDLSIPGRASTEQIPPLNDSRIDIS